MTDDATLHDFPCIPGMPVGPALREAWSATRAQRELSDELVRMRDEAGLSQAELARLMKKDPAQIARWESGRGSPPKSENVAEFSRHCGYGLGYAFFKLPEGKGVGSETDREDQVADLINFNTLLEDIDNLKRRLKKDIAGRERPTPEAPAGARKVKTWKLRPGPENKSIVEYTRKFESALLDDLMRVRTSTRLHSILPIGFAATDGAPVQMHANKPRKRRR